MAPVRAAVTSRGDRAVHRRRGRSRDHQPRDQSDDGGIDGCRAAVVPGARVVAARLHRRLLPRLHEHARRRRDAGVAGAGGTDGCRRTAGTQRGTAACGLRMARARSVVVRSPGVVAVGVRIGRAAVRTGPVGRAPRVSAPRRRAVVRAPGPAARRRRHRRRAALVDARLRLRSGRRARDCRGTCGSGRSA